MLVLMETSKVVVELFLASLAASGRYFVLADSSGVAESAELVEKVDLVDLKNQSKQWNSSEISSQNYTYRHPGTEEWMRKSAESE